MALEAPIGKFVPGFRHPVTLRQILTHTSGIRHCKPGESNTMERFPSLADAIRILEDDPLEFEPGTATRYSTYAFNLLQGVVGTATGVPLEDYLEEAIYRPAGPTQRTSSTPSASFGTARAATCSRTGSSRTSSTPT